MQTITTIGLDIANQFFRFTELLSGALNVDQSLLTGESKTRTPVVTLISAKVMAW